MFRVINTYRRRKLRKNSGGRKRAGFCAVRHVIRASCSEIATCRRLGVAIGKLGDSTGELSEWNDLACSGLVITRYADG
jgi:hypothetical protein